jgi:hypothetical protein
MIPMRHLRPLFLAVACFIVGAGVASAAPALTLTWTDNSDNETGFRVERKVGTGAWVQLGTLLPGNAITATDAGPFTMGTTYTYRVCAFNAWGDSAWSNEAAVLTATPAAPGTVKVTIQVQVTVLRADYPILAATLKP